MYEVLLETFRKTLEIAVIVIPLLFFVEYFNHRYGDGLVHFFESRKAHMPFWAAVLSMLPGCNVAVAVGLLYLRGYLSMGSLVAAMIATSDEAIYVFIPQGFNFVPLFLAKLLLAIFAGYLLDLVTTKRKFAAKGTDEEVDFCCHTHEHASGAKEMFRHSLKHSLKIVLFVFGALFAFNYFKDFYGFERLGSGLLNNGDFSPLIAAIVGLIPGCGTSVVLATLYSEGIIGFGAALAGLSVASGDVLLVLIGSKMSLKNIAKILIYVFLIAVIFGYLAQLTLLFK